MSEFQVMTAAVQQNASPATVPCASAYEQRFGFSEGGWRALTPGRTLLVKSFAPATDEATESETDPKISRGVMLGQA